VVAGITEVDRGRVSVTGVDLAKLGEVQRDRFRAERIGYVFQTFHLLPALTALENVLLGMSFGGASPNRSRAIELLQQVGLGQRLNHKPAHLSVGEQQRVSVARALAKTPRLLLADEPTANVDPANQQVVLDLLRQACSQQQVSLLLVTHAPEVVRQFARVETLAQFNQAGRAE
jgi:putative ABC transport system ATP-binding protein